MAINQQADVYKKQLDNYLERLAEMNPQQLGRRDALGSELCFEELAPYFEALLSIWDRVRCLLFADASEKALKQLSDRAGITVTLFDEILSFDASADNMQSVRSKLLHRVPHVYDDIYEQIPPRVTFEEGTALETVQQSAREALESVRGARDEAAEARAEAAEVVAAIKAAAGEAGVERHAGLFRREAEEHMTTARWWLVATFGLCILTLGAAIWNYQQILPGATMGFGASVQTVVARLLLFSILYFALILSGRNYRAHRHNAIVNTHRQNALTTFETFAKSGRGRDRPGRSTHESHRNGIWRREDRLSHGQCG